MPPNPYEPTAHAGASTPPIRWAMFTAATLNLGLALAAGALIAFVCLRLSPSSTDDFAGLLVFFLSIASVFGIGGAYLACRHIQNRAPLWAIPTAIGTFAIVLPLASYPNVAPVINWIAGLAAACALISTAVAVIIRGGVYFRRDADMG